MRYAVAVLLALMPPLAAHGQSAPQAAPDRDLAIVNHAAHVINEIYVSPSDVDSWGEDRLGESTLASGATAHVRLGHGHGCAYDVQVVFEDASREEAHNVDTCKLRQIAFDGSGAARPAATEASHDVTIANHAARPIQQVLLSSSAAGDWGDDRLSNRSISVGDSAVIHYRGDCVADLRVVYDNRAAEERRDIDLCVARRIAIQPGWTTADTIPTEAQPGAETVQLTVTNRTGHAASRLYVFAEGSADLGPDLLDSAGLADGAQVAIGWQRPPGACRFAARIVYGAKVADQELRGIDLCRSPRLVLPRRG